ncbi:LytR family transcriptional regulator, partial [Streptomyces sp. 2MCAF27]
MDAQGHGQADDFDPADQWVFDPNTGSYELRLNPAGDSADITPEERPAPRPRSRRRAEPEPPATASSSA